MIRCLAVCLVISIVMVFCSCMSEEDKQDLIDMVSSINESQAASNKAEREKQAALSKSSSASGDSKKESSSVSSSEKAENSQAVNSGSTQIDNKPPVASSSSGSSARPASISSKSGAQYFNNYWIDSDGKYYLYEEDMPPIEDGGEYSSVDDWSMPDNSIPDYEWSDPTDWQKPHVPSSNSGKYEWEIPENIPKDEYDLYVPPFEDYGWGDSGQNGSIINYPELSEPDNEYQFNAPSSGK